MRTIAILTALLIGVLPATAFAQPPDDEPYCEPISITGIAPLSGFGAPGFLRHFLRYFRHGETLPYRVPEGMWLGIYSITWAHKNIGFGGRSSYFMLWDGDQEEKLLRGSTNWPSQWWLHEDTGVFTVPSHALPWSTPVPFVLPPGFHLAGAINNQSGERQNVNYLIVGRLADNPLMLGCE